MKPTAILFALPMEARPFLRMMEDRSGNRIQRGYIAGMPVLVGVSGIGPERARSAARNLLAEHDVAVLIAAGFAGALDEGLSSGDVVVADSVIDAAGEPEVVYACDASLSAQTRTGARVLSIDRVTHSPEEKLLLFHRYACGLVDMESGAIAAVAMSLGVRFAAVRSIVDSLHDTLPPELTSAIDDDGKVQVLQVILAILRRSGAISDIIRYHEKSSAAARNLAHSLREMIA